MDYASIILRIMQSLKNMPMGDELKWLQIEGGGCIFKSCNISLENTPTSHAVSLALGITQKQQWCMSAFVLLLLRCFLLNIMGGCTFERKAPFATTSFKKGGWAYFRGCYAKRIKNYLRIIGKKIQIKMNIPGSFFNLI